MSIRLRLGPFSVSSRGRVGARVGPVGVYAGGRRRTRRAAGTTRRPPPTAFERQIADGERWLREHPEVVTAARARGELEIAAQRSEARRVAQQSSTSSRATQWWRRRRGTPVAAGDDTRDEAPNETPARPPVVETSGRAELLERLGTVMTSARGHETTPPHVLLTGTSGEDAAMLARIVADELGATFVATSGPALGRTGDLAALLCDFAHDGFGVLFIDEAHRLRGDVEALLTSVLEDGTLPVMISEDRSVTLPLGQIVCVGAASSAASLSNRLLSCFSFRARSA